MVKLVAVIVCIVYSAGVSGQGFISGRFYTTDGKKVIGKIKFNANQYGYLTGSGSVPGKIKIKTEHDGKVLDVDANELRAFVIGTDSFIVFNNIPVSRNQHFGRDIVKVEEIGRLNLYIHFSQIPQGRFGYQVRKVYILSRRNSKKLYSIYEDEQKDTFLSLLSGAPEIAAALESDPRWRLKIPQATKDYNKLKH